MLSVRLDFCAALEKFWQLRPLINFISYSGNQSPVRQVREATALTSKRRLVSEEKKYELCSPNDNIETGRDDVLGLPLSGVDPRHTDWPAPVGGLKADCGFNADPGRYEAVCGHAVLGRPDNINAPK